MGVGVNKGAKGLLPKRQFTYSAVSTDLTLFDNTLVLSRTYQRRLLMGRKLQSPEDPFQRREHIPIRASILVAWRIIVTLQAGRLDGVTMAD